MRSIVVLTIVLLLLSATSCQGIQPSGGLTYGNNIWGNSLGLCLDVPLSESFFVQLAYGSGYFNFTTKDQGDFLFYENLPGDEHRVTIDLKQAVDISMCYRRNEVRQVHFFNEFGAGITHVLVRFRSEYERSSTSVIYRAERDYSLYGLVVAANVLDFEPGLAGDVVFSLGVRSRLVWLDSPQVLRYTYGPGFTVEKTNTARHGDTLYYPYPEVFLTARYRF